MLPPMMMLSNSTSLSDELSSSSVLTRVHDFGTFNPKAHTASSLQQQAPPPPVKIKKKRNLPGNPDPDAEVIALSPHTLMATNRFVCEVCNKGFQRDQNLQLHRRGHNLPWKLKQKSSKENRKKAYVCPEKTCVHHHPGRALGDLTGIKKHYCRKHGEKKFKCDKCSKIYAVRSDWKAHSKICGTKEYKCDCGTIFSRKDSFITHRAFCDALSDESARMSANPLFPPPLLPPPTAANSQFLLHPNLQNQPQNSPFQFQPQQQQHHLFSSNSWDFPQNPNPNQFPVKPEISPPAFFQDIQLPPPSHKRFFPLPDLVSHFSATALLQKAAVAGPHSVGQMHSTMTHLDMVNMAGNTPATGNMAGMEFPGDFGDWQKNDRLTQTRDFLGLTSDQLGGSGGGGSTDLNGSAADVNMRGLMSFAESLDFSTSASWRNC